MSEKEYTLNPYLLQFDIPRANEVRWMSDKADSLENAPRQGRALPHSHTHKQRATAPELKAQEAQRERVRQAFREAGISLSEWARAHGFSRMTVVDVLRGHRAGHRGEAHRVAVALGLKAGKVVDPRKFKPAGGRQS